MLNPKARVLHESSYVNFKLIYLLATRGNCTWTSTAITSNKCACRQSSWEKERSSLLVIMVG